MKRIATVGFAFAVVLLLAPAAFAEAQPTGPSGPNWLALGSAFGMALAAAGCGYAQSRVAGAACEGLARNPGAAEAIRAAMFLGLVFIETLALFTLVIIFTIIFRG